MGVRMRKGYRLVAIDVDGTLIEPGKPVSAAVRQAVARAQRQGVIITLASGRMYPLLERLVGDLGLRSPVICYGGALVVDPSTRGTIYRKGVPAALARDVIHEARRRNLPARVYVGERVFVERLVPGAFNYESLLRVKATEVKDLLGILTDDPSHLAVDAPPDQTRRLVGEMRQMFSPGLHVTTGHPLLTEFSHPEVNKGSTLAWLANALHVPREETLAIGDDWNDVEMLHYAGLGVAVENAHPDVLAIADAVVPDVADDGVAVAIERFVLQPDASSGEE